MPPQLLYGAPAFLGLVMAVAVALHAWQHRTGPGWRELTLFGGAVAWWCATELGWVLAGDPALRIRIAQLQYLGITTTPVFWFLVALSYAKDGHPLTGWRKAWLFLVPALMVALVFTNERHGLVWASIEISASSPEARIGYGPGFFLHAVWAYALAMVAAWILVTRFAASPLYRRQLAVVALGTGFFLVVSVLHVTRLVSLPVDPTPLAFAIVFASLGWATRKHRLFELVPVARGIMVERLLDGVLVTNPDGQIVDANRAAGELLRPWRDQLLGVRLRGLMPEALSEATEGQFELHMAGARTLEFRFSSILSPDQSVQGRVVLVRDVTRERADQAELQAAQASLSALNVELERLARTDPLTGLANRRRLLEELDREWARSVRTGQPLSLLLLDLDHFKRVNDEHGHLVGDKVLETVGGILSALVRPQDLPARFGGEELAVLFTNTDLASATIASERLLEGIRSHRHADDLGVSFLVTTSGGLARRETWDETPRDLLARADHALYQAKAAGRDRVVAATGRGAPRDPDGSAAEEPSRGRA
jgi:diguanylate cyclase (GGDEF)-like protein